MKKDSSTRRLVYTPGSEIVVGHTLGIMTRDILEKIFPGGIVETELLDQILFTGTQCPTCTLAYPHRVAKPGPLSELIPSARGYLFSGISHAVRYFQDRPEYTLEIGRRGLSVYVPFSVAWKNQELHESTPGALPKACVLHVFKHAEGGTGCSFLPLTVVVGEDEFDMVLLCSPVQ